MMRSDAPLIAVCSWSLEPSSIDDLTVKVRACGLDHVQLALSPLIESPQSWSDVGDKLRAASIGIVSGMLGFAGEDYSTISQIKKTGGVMPDETYPATLDSARRAATVAAELGIELLTFHAGFIPHEPQSADFQKGLKRVCEITKLFNDAGVQVALETGQEPAGALLEFLNALQPVGVGVNFDPANMLLYGSGDPIDALQQLLPHVRQVHIKDAVASKVSGEWGSEVPAGTGQVDWPRFFSLLKSKSFARVIEREAGTNRIEDVVTARELIRRGSGV